MYAIIETGGKQYRVKESAIFTTEKISGVAAEDEVEFDRVLLISGLAKNEMDEIKVGKPYVKGAQVKAKVLDQGRGEKITIFKYKKRKRYRRKIGHRQPYTQLQVTEIKG